jgi:N-methylhydantoinase A
MNPSPAARVWRVAIDTGGTFTDAYFLNERTGHSHIAKVPSTPDQPELAVIESLRAGGVSPAEVKLLTHGTTVATNALITRRLSRAAMVTTKGFRDVVEIRDGTKEDLWDAYKDAAPPYIRRRDRFEVNERIDHAGRLVEPLDEVGLEELSRILKRRNYEAVAVCFMNSYVNVAHETRARQILEAALPGVFICASAEIVPEMFEHPRFSTAMINAATGPVVGRYIAALDQRLKAGGYQGELLILHSGGGVLTAEGSRRYAARLASSGIVAGAIAGGHIARECGFENAISLDMGGTSTDISLMYRGQLRTTQGWHVEYGHPIMFPSVEVMTIGAGGGSIAWIDAGGSLHNGPQSAGADPGPACYGKGGDDATNTDANVVLGRLGASLLDGRVALDARLARSAIAAKIAGPLGLDETAAAHAVVRVANVNMANATKLISVGRGFDPRDFALVVFGGAGPLHGCDLARDLDVPVVIFPRHPGIASAMGCLLVDIRHDLSAMCLFPAEDATLARIFTLFERLEVEARGRLTAEGVANCDMVLSRGADMRYAGQWRQLTIGIAPGDQMADVLARFHTEHERTFAFRDQTRPVEVYAARLVAKGTVPKPPSAAAAPPPATEPAVPFGTRAVFFPEMQRYVDTPLYRREVLTPGARVEGPAIIEQLDSTVMLSPGTNSVVTADLHIVTRFTEAA